MAEPPANPGEVVGAAKKGIKAVPKPVWIGILAVGAIVVVLAWRRQSAAASAVADPGQATTAVPSDQTGYTADMYAGALPTSPPIQYSGNTFGGQSSLPDWLLSPPDWLMNPPAGLTNPPAPSTGMPLVIVNSPAGADQSSAPVAGAAANPAAPTGGGPPGKPATDQVHSPGTNRKNELQAAIRSLNSQADGHSSKEVSYMKGVAHMFDGAAAELKSLGASVPAPSSKYKQYVTVH